jgi:hypothetical protein
MNKNPIDKKFVMWFVSDFAGCGFLRSLLPNELLNSVYGRKQKYEGLATNHFILDKNALKSAKAIHFQRQVLPHQIDFIELFRRIRNENPDTLTYKLIYDMDDLFTEIPTYNYCYPKFLPNVLDINGSIQRIKNSVDVMTFSTYPLKKKIMEIGENKDCKFEVVPNFLPRYVYGGNAIKIKNLKPRIVWAGSSTHLATNNKGDFEPIYELLKNTCDEFEWIFCGLKKLQGWMLEFDGKIKLMPWVSLLDLPYKLKELNADFGVAPLLDNNFNRSKSNIKLLDYCSAGIIAICSKVKPYEEESKVFLYGKWEEDRKQILDIFNSEQKKEEILTKQRRLLERYWLENNLDTYVKLFDLNIGGK